MNNETFTIEISDTSLQKLKNSYVIALSSMDASLTTISNSMKDVSKDTSKICDLLKEMSKTNWLEVASLVASVGGTVVAILSLLHTIKGTTSKNGTKNIPIEKPNVATDVKGSGSSNPPLLLGSDSSTPPLLLPSPKQSDSSNLPAVLPSTKQSGSSNLPAVLPSAKKSGSSNLPAVLPSAKKNSPTAGGGNLPLLFEAPKMLSGITDAMNTLTDASAGALGFCNSISLGLSFSSGGAGVLIEALVMLAQIIIENWDTIGPIIAAAAEFVCGIFKGIWDFIVGVFNSIVTTLSTVGSAIWGWLCELFGNIWSGIQTAFSIWVSYITTCFDVICGVWNAVVNVICSVVSGIITWISTFFTIAYNLFLSIISSIIGFFTGLFSKLVSGFSQCFSAVMGYIIGFANGMIGAFETAANFVIDIINSLINFIITGIKNAINLVLGAVNGIAKLLGIDLNLKITGSAPQIPKLRLPRLADGGIPSYGQMFIAREAGAELVGGFGRHTAVMNNDQIVESVSNGVYKAVKAAMATKTQAGGKAVLTLDKKILGEFTIGYINDKTKEVGLCPILV